MHAHSVVVLNQRCWQSLGGQHGKSVDGLFEKVSFQTAFEGEDRYKTVNRENNQCILKRVEAKRM